MRVDRKRKSLSNPFKPSDFSRICAKLLKGFGVPDGIRTRVTAVKGRCPDHWTTGTQRARVLPFS